MRILRDDSVKFDWSILSFFRLFRDRIWVLRSRFTEFGFGKLNFLRALAERREQTMGFFGFPCHLAQMVCGRFVEFTLEELNLLRFLADVTEMACSFCSRCFERNFEPSRGHREFGPQPVLLGF